MTTSSRHAGALALVGWYLMVPPTVEETSCTGITATIDRWFDRTAHDRYCEEMSKIVAFQAPLNRWHDYKAFETLAECEVERQRISTPIAPSDPRFSARCIATDDPRLKEK